MKTYQQFIFENYEFDETQKTLSLHYSLDKLLNFTETYRFNFDFVTFNKLSLESALESLFLMAGISYYKTYLPKEIVIAKGSLSPDQATFFSKTYQRGLGEFFYVNKLDPNTPIEFPSSPMSKQHCEPSHNEGLLVGIGGGKDSLVSVEILRTHTDMKLATWSMGHHLQLASLIKEIGLPHFSVEREWDKQLIEVNKQDAYNGHVPISAIFATMGTVVSILTGYQDAVVSNESSASDPNLTYQDVDINHQYSKSLEFENDYQNYLKLLFGESLRYYSFLRPLTELRIAELFANIGFEKYKGVFSSCNHAYKLGQNHMIWCGECPKCAFVFLALTPFVERAKLETLWGGKNLLLDPKLEPTYRQLLGIEGDKPMECVGEIKESRAAMRLAQKQYPELSKYQFDIPADYDYKKLSPHLMPEAMYKLVSNIN